MGGAVEPGGSDWRAAPVAAAARGVGASDVATSVMTPAIVGYVTALLWITVLDLAAVTVGGVECADATVITDSMAAPSARSGEAAPVLEPAANLPPAERPGAR